MKPTPYEVINKLLLSLQTGIKNIFGKNLVGIYLTGSLSYDDFNLNRSDIDLLVVLHDPVTKVEVSLIKELHAQVGKNNNKWSSRIECSYIPKDMLVSILPPKLPRPYYGGGIFYPQALYGNEWLINNYFLYNYSISLYGPDFKILTNPIEITEVQKACVRDLFTEWVPKITDDAWLAESHHQSYLILNLCRILYTLLQAEITSKTKSTAWVKKRFPQWKNLIEEAEDWTYGKEMQLREQTKEFIKFSEDKVRSWSSSLLL